MLLSYAMAKGQYDDHRNHQLDSLESVVAPWTVDRVALATYEEKDMLSDAYHDLMWGYSQINPARSLYFARKTFDLCLQEQWLNQAFQAARMIGQHHWAAGQIDSAKTAFATALAIADKMALKEPLPGKPNGYKDATIDDAYSSLYGALGNMYSSLDSIPQAMEYYHKAGELFEKNGWLESCAVLYHNMGETWLDAGDLKEAEVCYNEALKYGQEAEDSLQIAEAKAGLGALYLEQGKTRKALKYLQEADRYFSANEDQEYRNRIYTLDLRDGTLERPSQTAIRAHIAELDNGIAKNENDKDSANDRHDILNRLARQYPHEQHNESEQESRREIVHKDGQTCYYRQPERPEEAFLLLLVRAAPREQVGHDDDKPQFG